jgi:hypothetical protein
LLDIVGRTANETLRYSRHLVLPEVGSERHSSGRLDKT